MLKPMLALVTCTLLSLAGSTFADSNNTNDSSSYHFQATLSGGSSSLRRVDLPWPVVSNLLQSNLQDLQVYNGNQQAIPFTIRPVAAAEKVRQETRTLNFFSMGDIEKLATILQQEAGGERYQSIKLVQAGQRYLIVDNPKPETDKNPVPLETLVLNWQALNQWLPKSLRVEASDDLTKWHALPIKKLPYRMTENGVELENRNLSFKQPTLKRFIRLSGAEDFEPLIKSLKGVSGHYENTRVIQPLNWNHVNLLSTEEARQYRYDLPPSVNVKRWRLSGLTPDSLYKGRLFTRSTQRVGKKPTEWRMSQNFLQYSIKMNDGLVTSEASHVMSNDWSREWLIDMEQDISADSPPQLALAWEPLELVFVAQGNGPFKIRYASRTAQQTTRMNLGKLLKEATPEAVTIGEITQLSEVAEKEDGSPYKYLLWGLLAAAVLMLLYMAKGLLREMGAGD